MMKKYFLIMLSISAIGLAGCSLPDWNLGSKNQACTMEAKICSDGSAVGRSGPNCEFAACPEPELCSDGSVCQVNASPTAQLANPASVNCQAKGGTLEISADSAGNQVGICIFSDGSKCEEWAYMRGECQPGNSLK